MAENDGGSLRLPRLIRDGMVLQRDMPVRIWGRSAPGAAVSVRFLGREYHTAAGADGKWQTVLGKTAAGGPYEMEIESDRKITLKNILVGEVWVCSGQSNMELPILRVRHSYPREIAAAENPGIRLFLVERDCDFGKERNDLPAGEWIAASPRSVLHFSAAAYFFADEIFRTLRVPVGIISASVGGSTVEAWLNRASLSRFPHYREIAERMADPRYAEALRQRDAACAQNWNRKLNETDAGLNGALPWYDPALDDSGWGRMAIPGSWNESGPEARNGAFWFRRKVNLPAGCEKLPAVLYLGAIVDADQTYINGIPVGETTYRYPPRRYEIPEGVLKPGANVVAIRVISSLGKGGFVREKDYALTVGEERFDLSGNWKFRVGVRSLPLPEPVFLECQPGGLFNAMIAPLLRCTVRGILWYQGESSTAHPAEYKDLFEELIRSWRDRWGLGDFPFLFVQLANYGEIAREPAESDWAAVRQAQLEALELPGTGMAVAADIGDWNDLHPQNKKEIGRRLAQAAKRIAYGDRSVTPMGPVVQSVRRDGGRLLVRFQYAESGLTGRRGSVLSGFELCGCNRRFRPAEAVIEGTSVSVRRGDLPEPAGIRYAWADSPAELSLYNQDGLPASPFQMFLPDAPPPIGIDG